jgi:outer membrane protein TolC
MKSVKMIFNMTTHKALSVVTASLMILWISLPAGAQQDTVFSFSLQEAQEYAVRYNLSVKLTRQDLEYANKQIKQYLSTGLPQVNSNLNYQNNLDLRTTLMPDFIHGDPDKKIPVQFGSQHNADFGVSVTQMIFNGPFIVGLEATKLLRQLNEQNVQKSETDIRETVAQTYYLVLIGKKTEGVIRENLENMKKTLEDTRKMYEAGFTEDIAVDQLQVSVTSLENAVKSARRQIQASERLLKFQMGIDFDQKIELTDSLDRLLTGINVPSLLVKPFRVDSQIEYKVANTRQELAAINLKKEKYTYMPSLNANYQNQWSAMRSTFSFFDFNENWYHSSFVGVTLAIPIFSSGFRKSNVDMRRIELEKASINKDLLSENLKMQYEQARDNLITAWENYLAEKKNVELAKKVVDKTSIKVSTGTASSLDLTQVNNQYLQTQTRYFTAMIDLLKARIHLDRLLNQM